MKHSTNTILHAAVTAAGLALASCGGERADTGGAAAVAEGAAARVPAPPTGEAARETAFEALSVLEAFWGATTSFEALRYVSGADQVEAEVKNAFSVRNSNPPAEFSHVGSRHSRPELGERPGALCHVFSVQPEGSPAPPPFPVAVYPHKGGYRINWREFAQFRDDTLTKFFEKGRSPGVFGEFQVVAVRGHYFGDSAGDLPGGAVCLKLQGSRGQEDSAEVLVAEDSAAWRAIEPFVGFDRLARLKLQIRWEDRGGGELLPIVTGLVDSGWFGWSGSGSVAGK